MYVEQTSAGRGTAPSMPSSQPAAPSAPMGRQSPAPEMPPAPETSCGMMEGLLPGGCCAPMAFPYVPMQGQNAKRYDNREALEQGTLFPGLDLPFRSELKTRFPAVNPQLSELMALDFAIDELGLYLTTHRNDQDALELYWNYIRLGREGRKRYEASIGPLLQTDITEGSYKWLDDPWPWDEGRNA